MNGKLHIEIDRSNGNVEYLDIDNNISNTFKNEILELLKFGRFFDFSGSSITSSSIDVRSSMRENGWIVGHFQAQDAIGNYMSLVNSPSANSVNNSSIFFDDITRNITNPSDTELIFEQKLKNSTQFPYVFRGFSLIKNPTQYTSYYLNGTFENSSLTTGGSNLFNVVTYLLTGDSYYRSSNSQVLKITPTQEGLTSTSQFIQYPASTFMNGGSSITGSVQISFAVKGSSNNIRGQFRIQNQSAPFNNYINSGSLNITTDWTTYEYSGSVTSDSFVCLHGPSGTTANSTFYDCVRYRPYPLFTQGKRLGTQISYVTLSNNIILNEDDVIKIQWKLTFNDGK